MIALATLAACADNAETRSAAVDQLYMKRFNDRLAGYNSQAQNLSSTLNRQISRAALAEDAAIGLPRPPFTLVIQESYQLVEISTRSAVLTSFIREAAPSGRPGFMNSWVADKAEKLIVATHYTNAATAAYRNIMINQPQMRPAVPQVIKMYTALLIQRAVQRGDAEELRLLSNDIEGFRQDYAAATADNQPAQEQGQKLFGDDGTVTQAERNGTASPLPAPPAPNSFTAPILPPTQ